MLGDTRINILKTLNEANNLPFAMSVEAVVLYPYFFACNENFQGKK